MSYTPHTVFDKFFRNNDGALIIWQFPNLLLWGWIVGTLLDMIIKHGKLHTGFQLLAQALLFAWAYLELRSGESMFRKVLGGVVLVATIYPFFK